MKIIKITLNSNDSLGKMSNLGEMFYKRFEKNKIFKNFPEILHSSAARPLWQDLSDIKFALYSQRHYTIFTLYCYIIILFIFTVPLYYIHTLLLYHSLYFYIHSIIFQHFYINYIHTFDVVGFVSKHYVMYCSLFKNISLQE